ncbi:hypothetical protein, partial [Escherichia coli]|nr:hypothetical protein [Escherichia coli]
ILGSKKRIAPLLDKIDQQRTHINTLTVEVKQYKNRLRRLERRQRIINVGFGITTIVLVLLLVYTTWLNYN